MNCREWKQQFDAWMRTNWADSDQRIKPPAELVDHAEVCTGCGFQYEQLCSLESRQDVLPVSPEFLADKIFAGLRPYLEKSPRPGRIFAPVAVLAGFAAAVTVLIFALLFFAPQNTAITVRFTLAAPGAQRVSVVGDWNGWNPDVNVLSDADRDGVWEGEISLVRNKEYRYQFNINGDLWLPDPGSSLQVDDGFGGINSVLGI